METSLHERQFLIILNLDRPLRRFISLVDDEPGPDGDGPIRRRGVGILAGEELQPESPQGLGVYARRARDRRVRDTIAPPVRADATLAVPIGAVAILSVHVMNPVSYTHLTLPTTPYV